MPAKTPPKGRPTPGRRDRSLARQRAQSRTRLIKAAWIALAVVVLGALLVVGSGTGGNGNFNQPVHGGLLLPLILRVRHLRW